MDPDSCGNKRPDGPETCRVNVDCTEKREDSDLLLNY